MIFGNVLSLDGIQKSASLPIDIFSFFNALQKELIIVFRHSFIHSIDVAKAQRMAKGMPKSPLEMRASPADNKMGAAYFSKNSKKIKENLLKHGAIWLRGFDLMKGVAGYRTMYESLGFDPCLDPLHSSGLRKFASERDALYEEVSFYFVCFIWRD